MKHSLFILLVGCLVGLNCDAQKLYSKKYLDYCRTHPDTLNVDASAAHPGVATTSDFKEWIKSCQSRIDSVNGMINRSISWKWHPTSADDQNGYYILVMRHQPSLIDYKKWKLKSK